jgi:hypothetical protein
MLNSEFLYKILPFFSDLPCEIQTNGELLAENPKARVEHLTNMVDCGMDIIAISMDSPQQFELYDPLFYDIVASGLVARITVNMTDKLAEWLEPNRIIGYCIRNGIRQLTFRHINVPANVPESKYTKWIEKHAWPKESFDNFVRSVISGGQLLRDLNTGVQIYDVCGVSLGISKYCIQDYDSGYNLRSLIFQEDGHVYTSWGSDASILF